MKVFSWRLSKLKSTFRGCFSLRPFPQLARARGASHCGDVLLARRGGVERPSQNDITRARAE